MTIALTLLGVASAIVLICVVAASRNDDSLRPFDDYARAADNPLFATSGEFRQAVQEPDVPLARAPNRLPDRAKSSSCKQVND